MNKTRKHNIKKLTTRKYATRKNATRKNATRKNATRKNVHATRKEPLEGGFNGYCFGYGPRPITTSTIDRFATYWRNEIKCDVWYSRKWTHPTQQGYFFSNRQNCAPNDCLQIEAHTHIYEIKDLDEKEEGLKEVGYAIKTSLSHIPVLKLGKSYTKILQYSKIANWLYKLNEIIKATRPPCVGLADRMNAAEGIVDLAEDARRIQERQAAARARVQEALAQSAAKRAMERVKAARAARPRFYSGGSTQKNEAQTL